MTFWRRTGMSWGELPSNSAFLTRRRRPTRKSKSQRTSARFRIQLTCLRNGGLRLWEPPRADGASLMRR